MLNLTKPQPHLLDAEPSFHDSPDGLIIRKDQTITNDLLNSTAASRANRGREGEFMPVASIPTIVVERWLREGFDIFKDGITAHEIVARLRKEDLGAFLTTSKRV